MNINPMVLAGIFQMVIFPLFLSTAACLIISRLYKGVNVKRYFFIAFFSNVVLSTGSYLIVLPTIMFLVIKQLKFNDEMETIKCLFIIYISCLIFSIADIYMSFKYEQSLIAYLKAMSVIYLLAILLTTTITKFIKHFTVKGYSHRTCTPEQTRFRMIIGVSIPLTLFIFSIFPLDFFLSNSKMFFSDFAPRILPIIFVILILLIVYNYDKAVKSEVAFKSKAVELEQIKEYTNIVEDMYGETRRFKHDYMNMISSLSDYINNKNQEELKEFFNNNIMHMDKEVSWNNSNIDKLKYIKVHGLKGLISSKLINAITQGIDVKVNIIEDINSINMDTLDLCRIIGILLDNAIEASGECKLPKLQFTIVEKKDCTCIAIENNFFGQNPILHKIFKKGYSTKGPDRGLGLYNVKELIDQKYTNVCFNTAIENNMFTQELWIKKGPVFK